MAMRTAAMIAATALTTACLEAPAEVGLPSDEELKATEAADQALQDADEGLAPRVIKARAKELADGFALFPDERDEIVMEAMMSVASRAA